MIFGSLSLFGALATMLLPETMDIPMPQTLEEGNNLGRGQKTCAACVDENENAATDPKEEEIGKIIKIR